MAQQPPGAGTQLASKTKLEAFEAQTGTVIIRGFTKIGTLRGQSGTSVEVESREFTDATTGKKEYGMTVQVNETMYLQRISISAIDYDEIDSLLKGIDYIAKIDASVTKFANVQAEFRTKDDFSVSTSSAKGSVEAAVRSGRAGATMIFVKMADLQAFRDLVVKAQTSIDAVRVWAVKRARITPGAAQTSIPQSRFELLAG